jgi:MFS family permease
MVVDAATFGLSAVLMAGVRPARAPRAVERRGTGRQSSLIREFREGWIEFLRWEWLRAITVEFAIVNAAAIAPFYVLGPLAAEEAYSGVAAWALILGLLAAGRFVGGALASSWRPRRPLVSATVVVLTWAAPLVSLALRLPLVVVLCGVFLAGLGDAGFSVIWETTTQTNIPSVSRARLASVEALGSLVFVPVGFLIAGWLEPVIGMTTTLLFGAATVAVATVVTLRAPGVRQMRSFGGTHGPSACRPENGVDDFTRQAA